MLQPRASGAGKSRWNYRKYVVGNRKSFSRSGDMQRTLLTAAALLLAGPAIAQSAPQWVKGRVLVQARAGLGPVQMAERVGRPHAGQLRRMGQSDLYIMDLPAQASETAVLAQLKHHPLLKFAELDHLLPSALATNDPYLGSEWHVAKIGADRAWDTAQGTGVTIAILDSGVDATHPDMAGRLVTGWNFNGSNADTADVYGHGTKVAGSAAAAANNGLGVAGIAGQARIMPIRVTDASGNASISALAQGLTYAADNGARVANLSFAAAGYASVQSAAQYLKSKGGLAFASVGNTGAAVTTAPTTALVVVAATDANDLKASFSTFGDVVTLASPGVGIWTTTKGGGYAAPSGTSFAAPVAAGTAALLMSARPDLSAAQVESLLYSTAQDLGSAGRDPQFGHGRVDAAAAVAAALTLVAQDTLAPSVAIANPLAGASVSGLVPVDVAAADNVGVTRVELRANGALVATDGVGPFQFMWDSSQVPNGSASLVATAYDAAGNSKVSASMSVNVANAVLADTAPPSGRILNPGNGTMVSGTVAVSTSASDNSGISTLRQRLMLDGVQVASTTGGSLSWNWNTRKASAGAHTLTLVMEDAAGNTASTAVSVTR
jgi:hypothetical protein